MHHNSLKINQGKTPLGISKLKQKAVMQKKEKLYPGILSPPALTLRRHSMERKDDFLASFSRGENGWGVGVTHIRIKQGRIYFGLAHRLPCI